jgi:hypothetical protein
MSANPLESHNPDHPQVAQELSMDQLETVSAGTSWAGVALGAGALSTAAFSAAAFPATWSVPLAGAAMVATGATMAGVAGVAAYFASL